MRAELSKRFQEFFKRIESETEERVQFEVPFSDLAFEGGWMDRAVIVTVFLILLSRDRQTAQDYGHSAADDGLPRQLDGAGMGFGQDLDRLALVQWPISHATLCILAAVCACVVRNRARAL